MPIRSHLILPATPSFRARYAELLRSDFPPVPVPGSASLFGGLRELGAELVSLHLMESPRLGPLSARYRGPKNPAVTKVGWSDDTIWLAPGGRAGFHETPESVWRFRVGGYQVCDKWLKDRKGLLLEGAEIKHYEKIIVAIAETVRLMREIDSVIEGSGGWPDAFGSNVPQT